MKLCPNCRIQYSDDSLLFCLEDGTRLLNQPKQESGLPTLVLDERETVVRPNRITKDWEQSQATQFSVPPIVPAKSNPTNAVMITAMAICLLFICSIGGWFLFSGVGSRERDTSKNSNKESEISNTTPYPTPKILRVTPIDNRETNEGEIIDDNSTSRSSYIGCFKDLSDYDLDGFLERSARNTPERCIAACRAKGFRYAGVQYGESCLCGNSYGKYGAADNCNLPCTGDGRKICGGYSSNSVYATFENLTVNGGSFKACDRLLGSGLYNKWQEMGGEYGKLGCPTTNEAEVEPSAQGTTGRMIQFDKNDGGYLIWHGSGRFSGITFEVSGCMFKLYSSLGGTKSWLGFPVKDGYTIPIGAQQDFEAGFIIWDSKTYQCRAYKN